MSLFSCAIKHYKEGNLILQICIGIVLGILIGVFSKDLAIFANIFGALFTGALKAIAPILVFI
ncbi:serine/threonine transporter SstT, partial [Campylobacter lari]|nr:serine/threonine transporter SstT [Campylobacter lari]